MHKLVLKGSQGSLKGQSQLCFVLMKMILQHIHVPGLSKYSFAVALQSAIVERLLFFKAQTKHTDESNQSVNPTLITFQTPPTYTCGRREIGKLSASQIAYLKNDGKAEYHEALRGGQTTFHGPGQLTAFLISSLRDHQLKPRGFVHLLETMTMDTCLYHKVDVFTTENPGVWHTPDDKIASIGVRLQSGISSYGIGLNVSVDLSWFDRIVACGLVGKRATSLEKAGAHGLLVKDVAPKFAKFVARRLPGVNGRIEAVKPWYSAGSTMV